MPAVTPQAMKGLMRLTLSLTGSQVAGHLRAILIDDLKRGRVMTKLIPASDAFTELLEIPIPKCHSSPHSGHLQDSPSPSWTRQNTIFVKMRTQMGWNNIRYQGICQDVLNR